MTEPTATAPVQPAACCGTSPIEAPTTPEGHHAAPAPCCGTAQEAKDAGACCGTAAKSEAVASGAGCC
ncbi:hypothetical protein GCM10009665_10180 [Kitasatospora nipponensis]|uniref:ACGX-repeat peptide n=1 Tax=Kitasatospora nipponensis TaxID=258049 RepID=A0ABN1VSW2_9ACTN